MFTGMLVTAGILLVFAIGGLIVEIPQIKEKLNSWYDRIH